MLTPEEKRILAEVDLASADAASQEPANIERQRALKILHDDLLSGDPIRKEKAVKFWTLTRYIRSLKLPTG